jgi:hypothetical protein
VTNYGLDDRDSIPVIFKIDAEANELPQIIERVNPYTGLTRQLLVQWKERLPPCYMRLQDEQCMELWPHAPMCLRGMT